MPKARSSDTFFSSIPPVDAFESLTSAKSYKPLPSDWYLAISDVVDSTVAIANGDYKAVNTVGVACIAAITNALRPVELPYVFGGDGALVCIPPSGLEQARMAMEATGAMAKERFGLELRLAIVPVSYVRRKGRDVLVGRHTVSEHYDQCAFIGGGALFVEGELKNGALPDKYLVRPNVSANADYSGLECRWSEVPSPEDETVALIVHVKTPPRKALNDYRTIMDKIREIYGEPDRCRPVSERGLRVTYSPFVLRHESRVRTWGDDLRKRFWYAVRQRYYVFLGWLLFLTGARSGDVEWSRYKKDLIANTDFRKFDGCLRMVLAGSESNRRELTGYLDGRRDAGDIAYGLHVAGSAIMTCLVKQRQHAHVHFVDASGGGYAEAAKMMKRGDANETVLAKNSVKRVRRTRRG